MLAGNGRGGYDERKTREVWDMVGSVEELKKLLQQSRVGTFLGGAGVSTESGIPDFRSKGSAEAAQKRFGYPPEVLLSHDFFLAHPDIFYDYYKSVLLVPASPNPAHYALARLEAAGKLNAVITQNIDNLHQQAGSKRVYPVHGNVEWNRCMECNRFFNGDYIRNSQGVPHCDQCGGLIKPEVVLYGEPLDQQIWRGAMAAVSSADTMIVGGTSLSVYPAASLLEFFMGKHLILINKTETPYDRRADLILRQPIGQVLGEAVPQ